MKRTLDSYTPDQNPGTEADYVNFGDSCVHVEGGVDMQTQYASRYLDGRHGFADLGSDLRWIGHLGDYHGVRIHKDDVQTFIDRVKKHRIGLGW